MVAAYLDVAEIQALRMKTIIMQDWIRELDGFLTMTRSDILSNKGMVSHEKALKKEHEEYEKYVANTLTPAERDYIEIINNEVKN